MVNGAGSAGVAITKLLLTYGFKHVTMCDREGIIGKDYPNLNWMQKKMTEVTNLENLAPERWQTHCAVRISLSVSLRQTLSLRKWFLP